MALVGSLSASDGKLLLKDTCLVWTGSVGPGATYNTASICYVSESMFGIGEGLALGQRGAIEWISGSFIAKGGAHASDYNTDARDYAANALNNPTNGRAAILMSGTAGWARLDVTGAYGSPRVGNAATTFTGTFNGPISVTLGGLSDTDIDSVSGGHILVYDGSNSWDNRAVSGDITLSNTGVAAIANGVIINTDINNSAGIVDSKLQTISSSNKVALTALDIDGGSGMTAALAGADLFIIDDGAGGTNKKLDYNELCTNLLATASSDQASATVAKLLKTTSDGDLTLNDLTVQNLTVNGTTTSVDSTVVVVKDPIIQIGAGSDGASLGSDDNKDRGVEFAWYDSAHRHGFFGWDDSSGSFVVMSGAASSSEVYSGPLAKIAGGQISALCQTSNLGGVGIINSGALQQWSDILIQGNSKIAFQADTTNTYIAAAGSSPEDLEIHADGNIDLKPDNEVIIPENLKLTFGTQNDKSGSIMFDEQFTDRLILSSAQSPQVHPGLQVFNPMSNGVSAFVAIGTSGSDNQLMITAHKDSSRPELDYVSYNSLTSNGSADKGKQVFKVDNTQILEIDDGGLNLADGLDFEIDGTSVLNKTTLGTNVVASSLTSVGTLTTLTVDNVIINGTTIGHTDDTDLITLADQTITLASNATLVVPEGATIQFDSSDTYIKANADTHEDLEIAADQDILLKADNQILCDVSVLPVTDGAASLGADEVRWANVFTQDLWLKNSRGDWTLIEEEEFLSFRNNKNGKRYKMQMVEITGDGSYGPDVNGDM